MELGLGGKVIAPALMKAIPPKKGSGEQPPMSYPIGRQTNKQTNREIKRQDSAPDPSPPAYRY